MSAVDEIHEFRSECLGAPRITVGVSLFNYRRFVRAALESVRRQSLREIELIVVNDASSDDGGEIVLDWLKRNKGRFCRSVLVNRRVNAGLAAARNLAVQMSQAPYFFVLDADNMLYPPCLDRLLVALEDSPDAAFAYSLLEKFGEGRGLVSYELWSRERIACGNYIDAMALARVSCLRELGGYARMEVTGWEDYELWCRFAEKGWSGTRVPEIMARYRVHRASMLNSETRRADRTPLLHAEMKRRHSWLRIDGA